jgi:hypothetical protein
MYVRFFDILARNINFKAISITGAPGTYYDRVRRKGETFFVEICGGLRRFLRGFHLSAGLCCSYFFSLNFYIIRLLKTSHPIKFLDS